MMKILFQLTSVNKAGKRRGNEVDAASHKKKIDYNVATFFSVI